eukprot:scaffold38031_cov44-Prasinocladus_malaysianus.AAC.1
MLVAIVIVVDDGRDAMHPSGPGIEVGRSERVESGREIGPLRILNYVQNVQCIMKKAGVPEMQGSRKGLVPLPNPKASSVVHGRRFPGRWSFEFSGQNACSGQLMQ